jgi:hypothetical protein
MDVADWQWFSLVQGLTCDFWAENAKNISDGG